MLCLPWWLLVLAACACAVLGVVVYGAFWRYIAHHISLRL